jgi:uracil DNA glycosylase
MVKLNKDRFQPLFGEWWRYFEPLFDDTDIMENIYAQLKKLGKKGKIICPDSDNTFKSFEVTSPTNLNVVWVLLDPYPSMYDDVKTANGIAMDCSNRGVLQPSLEKFYEAIEHSECDGLNLLMEKPPSLEYLYTQGNMFLNTALTVEKDKTGSHTKMWQPFMEYFFSNVMSSFNGMIYVLCGAESSNMRRYINPLGNYIFEIEHPSFAARNYREWKYEGVFKKINYILRNNNNFEIKWVLEEPPF